MTQTHFRGNAKDRKNDLCEVEKSQSFQAFDFDGDILICTEMEIRQHP
jgi:hypothetical protein